MIRIPRLARGLALLALATSADPWPERRSCIESLWFPSSAWSRTAASQFSQFTSARYSINADMNVITPQGAAG